ncbi:hypothetical protein [Alkalihalobacillus pseudalcaliphilus]|uniref:hypothetical protein n=1 Tax=Alkalihalobacillus pseudalcaliphilus TaxID=79884 RepID=UPI00064D792A|nr:hypothetical protein [Alkalihalobacillus pseudalcaliphilus]KMK75021.1 hypothetical protein AB990_16255 [Alkalihalobacillus pseudalcaliphilus]
MFEIVQHSKQQKKFASIWEHACEKNGWENDSYRNDAVRYNLLISNRYPFLPKKAIGTVEFIPFDPLHKNSTVEGEGRSKFSHYPDIKANQKKTWEIDKLCLHESYQRQGHFKRFMEVFYDHALHYEPIYYIGLMEKKFYRMIKILYKLAVEQRGEELVGTGQTLVPVVLKIGEIMENKKMVERILREAK